MLDPKLIAIMIVLFPLMAAVIVGLKGKWIGKRGSHTISILAVSIAFLLSCWLFTYLYQETENSLNFTVYTWGQIGTFHLQIGFLIDWLSALMMMVVTFVSGMVHLYSVGYMQEDPGYQRFFSYIGLFTFGMLMLTMSNNFLQLFFGWEMVGVMSYLLIGFWFQKESAIFANLKAFIVNRIGDIGLLLGIAGILYGFNTLDYQSIFAQVELLSHQALTVPLSSQCSISLLTFICLCLFWGAMGKSAQIPLHVWLPDSMEGPTPISALIHAATMVTAGVFMLARLSPLLEYSELVLNVILLIGCLTCLLMGFVAIVQNDIKRIIAYSTLSQLGYMMVAVGVSAYPVAIFHLMTHAFFKALLFLGAGSVILSLHHEQDIWKMGNLKHYLPITYFVMLIGSLALIGFPFFSGFYSKDLIIEAVSNSNLTIAGFAYPIVLGSVYLTALYIFRLFFVVFHTKERYQQGAKKIRESGAIVWLPLILLAIPSLMIGGFFVKPLLQGFFKEAIVIHPGHNAFSDLQQHFSNVISMGLNGFKQLSCWLGLLGILTAWLCYVQYPAWSNKLRQKLAFFYSILERKYGFDSFYQWIVSKITKKLGVAFWQVGDQWLIDGMGVNGVARIIKRWAYAVRSIQTGYLYHYAFIMITGFLCLLLFLLINT